MSTSIHVKTLLPVLLAATLGLSACSEVSGAGSRLTEEQGATSAPASAAASTGSISSKLQMQISLAAADYLNLGNGVAWKWAARRECNLEARFGCVHVHLASYENCIGGIRATFNVSRTKSGDAVDETTVNSTAFLNAGDREIVEVDAPFEGGQWFTLQSAECSAALETDAAPLPISPDSGNTGGEYTVTCADGTMSQAGGKQGACSWHGGVAG